MLATAACEMKRREKLSDGIVWSDNNLHMITRREVTHLTDSPATEKRSFDFFPQIALRIRWTPRLNVSRRKESTGKSNVKVKKLLKPQRKIFLVVLEYEQSMWQMHNSQYH